MFRGEERRAHSGSIVVPRCCWRGVDSAVVARYFQRGVSPAGPNASAGCGVRGGGRYGEVYRGDELLAGRRVRDGVGDRAHMRRAGHRVCAHIDARKQRLTSAASWTPDCCSCLSPSLPPTTRGFRRSSGSRKAPHRRSRVAGDRHGLLPQQRWRSRFAGPPLPVKVANRSENFPYSAFLSFRRDLFSSRNARRSSATPSRRFHCS